MHLTRTALARHTESLSNIKAVVPPRQSADFFMPACRQSYPSLVGVETGHTIPARGNPDAVSLMPRVRPTTRTQVVSLKTSKEVIMTALTIGSSKIRQIDGFYSLNDLHVASGGAEKHQPAFFLRNEQTKALIEEVNSANLQNLNAGNPAIKTERGKYGGTYACKELVIAYAAWISPAFHLKVIRVFLGATRPALPVPSRSVYISAMQQTDINSRAHVIAQQYYSKFRAELMADFAAGKVQDVETWEPEITPALPKPEARPQINLFDPDEFMRVREIACKYLEDVAEKAKGGKVTPSLEIPDNVLAGIVAMQMWKNSFTLGFNHEGKATIWKTPDPFDAVTRIIADPGWANLEKIRQVFDACMTALSNRLGVGGTK